MTDLADGLCVGKWELFDSSEPDDHEQAKALCEACPALDWCREYVKHVQATTEYQGWGPTGTWAGEYYGRYRNVAVKPRRKEAQCGTASGYKKHYREGTPKCEPCRAAQAKASREAKRKKREQARQYGLAS